MGIDYQETFAHVAMLNTVHVLLSIAANLDWLLYQLDVKNAFLNEDLEEKNYMIIPPRFESKTIANKLCRLKKSLYGPKQSPRAWFHMFTKVLKENGYMQCQSDHTMFVKPLMKDKNFVRICWWYCYYWKPWGKDHSDKAIALNEFETKNLGHLKYFLEWKCPNQSI